MVGKKIGIITFHHADNLGAVLQAYALQTALEEKCGAKAEIIDYRCDVVEKTRYPSSDGVGVKALVKRLPLSVYYAVKRSGFDKFRKKRLHLSKSYTKKTVSECENMYDIFVAGSDQIWNLECSGNDDSYFLDFVSDKNKKYSYAASLGNYHYKESEKEHIKKLVDNFSAVSVREVSAVSELKGIGIENVNVHPDPVVLLAADEWKKIMSERLCNQKYVFVYLIQEDVNVMRNATSYAEKHKLKLINNKKSIEFMLKNSPADFLSWIYYSEAVFTNSFHGTAFSLIFNKPLAADIELSDGRVNNRIGDMLESVDATGCVLKLNSDVFAPNAAKALEKKGIEALGYLNEM